VKIDITRSKGPEELQRENIELLASIIDSAMDAIITTDDTQRIVLFNAAAERLFRCPKNEAMGSSVERFIPYRFRAGHSARVRKFGESGVTNRTLNGLGTVWGLRPTGEEFPIEASISKIEMGGEKFFTVVIRDITERLQAEEMMRESERRFRLVADTAPVLIWMSGTDKLCNYFNEPWLDFTGRSIQQELGNGWAEGVHSEDLQRCLDTYTQSFDAREKFSMEYRLRHHDGTYRWILDIGVPRFNEAHSFSGYIGACVDVTDQKRAEETLSKSEERFRLATQAGKMYAYEWDAATDIIVRSRDASSVLSWQGETSLTRQQLLARIHPDDRALFNSSVSERTPEHPDIHVSYRMLRPDGSVVWLEKTAHAFFDEDGRLVRMIGMVTDITERKRTEEALRASEERLRLAQSVAGIGTFERDLRTGVNTWTAELESMYGLPPGGFGKTLTAFEDLIHPDDRAEVVRLVDGALTTGAPTNGEWRVIWPDGSVHWLAGRWRVLMDESGEPSRVVGINMDFTERKRAEEALSSMSRKLLEVQEQERTRVARELHDDIGQRLALLAVELDQLQDKLVNVPPDILKQMRDLGRRTADISTDVHNLSHELHSSKLELLGVAGGMKSWCWEFGSRRSMQIDFKSQDLPNLPQEISLCLLRVLQEAVNNVEKHSGVKRIDVQLHEESGAIHLIVSDSGKGFDVAAVAQGDGLGLTSMRERVRLVNGTIAIESKPMAGTNIHVRVPIGSNQIAQKLAG